MCKKRCQEAIGYWTIGLQYLHLVKAVLAETIAQGNAHILVSDYEISLDQYKRDTQWSDHRIIIPLLFNFYHGVEVILKGFLVVSGSPPKKNHKLSRLVAAFEKLNPGHAIGATARKYITQNQLPEILSSFCETSDVTIDDYYQALKYPQSTRHNVYEHYPLKYKGEEGVRFFEGLAKDISEVVPQIVTLGRSMCPSAQSVLQPAK